MISGTISWRLATISRCNESQYCLFPLPIRAARGFPENYLNGLVPPTLVDLGRPTAARTSNPGLRLFERQAFDRRLLREISIKVIQMRADQGAHCEFNLALDPNAHYLDILAPSRAPSRGRVLIRRPTVSAKFSSELNGALPTPIDVSFAIGA